VVRPLPLATPQLVAEIDDGIGWLTLNNPDRLNAITNDMFDAFGEAADKLAADDDVRVIVMRGAGPKAFASGADISGLESPQSAGRDGLDRLSAQPKPVIAMIHGWCIGGGLMTALHADLRVASDDATFAIPAAKLGVGYPLDATERLVGLVGPGMAADILLTGDRFGADRAATMGLVQRVVPRNKLEAEVQSIARTIADGAPLTHAASKASIRATSGSDGDAAAEAIRACWKSADFAEGRAAFAARRPAEFTGR